MKTKTLKYLLICSFILLFTQCNYRTPSQTSFSNNLDIEIPKDVEVIQDEYQDMLQDFAIVYEIKLTNEQMFELIKSIRESGFFNASAFVRDYVSQDMFIEYNDMKAVWAKTDYGYIFQNEFYRDAYSAKIDTVNMSAIFDESHD